MHTRSAPTPALGRTTFDSARYSGLLPDATVTGISLSRPLSSRFLSARNYPHFPCLTLGSRDSLRYSDGPKRQVPSSEARPDLQAPLQGQRHRLASASASSRSGTAVVVISRLHLLGDPWKMSAAVLAVDFRDLLLVPGDGLVERHAAGGVLREHVGDDVLRFAVIDRE